MNERRKRAVALSYDQMQDTSPKIRALGSGKVADHIIELAAEHNIPIVQDQSLVEILAQLEIDETIPPELFEMVAEVFAFIYHLDKEY
ncbi:EscU/YscU/HrcU family type III secretion system export apparatus switch protein [Pseudogracilibacillus sp. ICA-222130]|uniref:EscU/YscU/HrcU family type III secretion system export apparatus switch protein n=1 Tax=Pseudogracilibacillus sp. ICA-222130 TaxID=3134655 RepID=UPI0030BBC65F